MTMVNFLYCGLVVYCLMAIILSPLSFWIAEDYGWAGAKLIDLNEYSWPVKIRLLISSFLIIAIISLVLCIPALLIALLITGMFIVEMLISKTEIDLEIS